jgi:holo-[acyl-carrier protein] synthase
MRTGIDAQSIDEVRGAVTAFGDRYLRRLFTPQEVVDAGVQSIDPASAASLAARFAAKEATLKALRVTDRIPPWTDIEVVREAGGAVSLRLAGVARELAAADGLTEFEVSLTHSGDIAIAVVVAA